METTIHPKHGIAPAEWTFSDTQSPYARVLRAASALESVAASLRAAEQCYEDQVTLRALVTGSGDLVELLAGVLSSQAGRMEDCPHCAHPTQVFEMKPAAEALAELAQHAAGNSGNGGGNGSNGRH